MSDGFSEDGDELTCRPLDTFNEIEMFLQNPPPWRSLCKKIRPHSKSAIKNFDSKRELRQQVSRLFEDGPEIYCHFDPDSEDVQRHHAKRLPKTLVCHDMANGYHDDRFIDGTGNYDAYTFYNWAGIDIFCYFSHHLITIPPLGWINVGHAHGVKVIGTVITEWADGMAFWDKILVSETEFKNFASALVAIAKTLKFDGWLLNIENKILKPDALLEFVKHLHTILHQELKDPVLIWYDSVTVDGHLNWQNALTNKNKAFFDVCDGIFTNYSWTEADVQSSAKEAGGRVTDLFIGIDVWGRNFFGGGQFNIQEAINVAYKNKCSLAIFAPAWTHEAMSMEDNDINKVAMADDLDKYEQFLLRDRALWDSVWNYLNTKLPCHLPFKTSFCRGQGIKRRLYGEVLCPGPWYNLRHMQYQPNSSHGPHGYLLSTIDNIIRASQRGLLKDVKGILKYREELKLDHIDLEPVGSLEENIHNNGVLPTSGSMNALIEEPAKADQTILNASEDSKESSSKGFKRKIKNAFKHIFRVKNSKIEQKDESDNTLKPSEEQSKLEIIEKDTDESPPFAINDKAEVIFIDPAKNDMQEKRSYALSPKKETGVVFQDAEEVQSEEDDDIGPKIIKNRESMVRVSLNIKLKDASEKTRYGLACIPDELPCLEVYFEDSFIGGSCLKINPSPEHLIRIFHCDFPCEDALIVCVVTKILRGYEQQFLNIKLFMKGSGQDEHRIVLIGRNLAHAQHPEESASCYVNLYPITKTENDFKEIQSYMFLNEPDFYVPVENSYNWNVRYYEIHLPGSRVTSINCDTGLNQGPILLGHLGICQRLRTPGKEKEVSVQGQ